jgi:predicted enzyme related to lactoylglutathione lyase
MPANPFVWYELMTKDIDAALAFYGNVLGWEGQDFPGAEERYTIVNAKGKGVGGIMGMKCDMSPCWIGYVGTPDIEKTLAGITRGGGTVHRGPWEIPNVGHIAVFGDPQGAVMALIQGTSEHKSEAFNQQLPGHGNWNELHTTDPAAAFTFYANQFGWTKGEAMDMGPMGTYQIFKADDAQIGGMVKVREHLPPHWLFYFGVEKIPAAVERVKAAGGTILLDPTPIPGGALIVQAKDPQGAVFAIVGPA